MTHMCFKLPEVCYGQAGISLGKYKFPISARLAMHGAALLLLALMPPAVVH